MRPSFRPFLLIPVVVVTLCVSAAFPQQSDQCPVEINGPLKGGPGNIQDNMFHGLAIDPTNENVVYAGTEASGIFKTTDGGATWTRLRKGFKCTSQKTGYSQIFDIAVDPTNPQTLYASTVNGPGPTTGALFPSASGGVYKSTDGGLTWVQKNDGLTNSYATYVLIDATNPSRLYVGIGGLKSTFGPTPTFFDGGIWVSSNAGDSWSPLTLPAGVNTNIFVDMVLRGANQRTLYATLQPHGSDVPTGYGLIRSTDGGATWSFANPQGVTLQGFDAYQQDPTVLYGHDSSPGRRVHKSIDGATTWNMIPGRSFFGVVKVHPRDSRIVFNVGRTSILKSADGFLTQKETYNDSGLSENQQMLDIKISQSNPNVIWACAKGYYLYKSTDGGETFTRITAMRDMIYGNPLSQNLPAAYSDASRITGMALVNSGSLAANATLAAYDGSGALMSVGSGRNPVALPVPAKGQVSRLVSELFGSIAAADGFWIKATFDRPGTTGFFLTLDRAVTTLDGAGFVNRLSSDFLFPEIQNAEITLVNPSGTSVADVILRLVNNDGSEQAAATNIRIAPNGRYTAQVSDLFAAPLLAADGYLRVTSSMALAATEQVAGPNRDAAILGAVYTDTASRFLYSPQYAVGGGYKSAVTLLNLEDTAATVSATWFDNAGGRRGRPLSLNIPGRGKRVISGADIFGVTVPSSGLDGYLVIGGPNQMVGTVRFGDVNDAQFQASLPLPTQGEKEVMYSHVAQDSTFFTGLAIVNTNSETANVTVSVFGADGSQVGGGIRSIPPNGRVSELLAQIDPGLPALGGGYFKVSSDRPVISFALFGTQSLSSLAALPGQ